MAAITLNNREYEFQVSKFPDCVDFPDVSLTGIFINNFPGFPLAMGTMISMIHIAR